MDLETPRAALLREPNKMSGSKGHCPWRGSKGRSHFVGVRGGSPAPIRPQTLAPFDSRHPRA
jgi:hypothetical protein